MRAGHQKCKEINTMATVTNSISQKKSGFFIWVLFIIHLSFSCPCPILTSHLLLNNLDGLWKSWVQWSSCPGSNGNLSFECLWTSVMLKMVNLKPPNRKCTLCINRRCYTKGLVKIKIKTVKVTWCRAKVKSHLWHLGFVTGIPRVGFSDTVPEPVNTVPVQPRVRYLWVMGTVFRKTRGTGGTRGFLVLFNITIY